MMHTTRDLPGGEREFANMRSANAPATEYVEGIGQQSTAGRWSLLPGDDLDGAADSTLFSMSGLDAASGEGGYRLEEADADSPYWATWTA